MSAETGSDYAIITRDTSKELMEAVNAYIAQKGYVPLGGVCVVCTDDGWVWCQAIVKRGLLPPLVEKQP
jgi:hypothetical protein